MSLKTMLNGWYDILKDEFQQDYMKNIVQVLKSSKAKVLPRSEVIFKALELTSPEDVKVVIIGQEPYYYEVADGLAFSCAAPNYIPASLENIIKELESDTTLFPPKIDFNLHSWANQGVLLLNTILTVEKNKPLSHKDIGWQQFTRKVVNHLKESDQPIVWMIWGKVAREFFGEHTNPNHLVLHAAHPVVNSRNNVPISRTDPSWSETRCFIGCNHFKEADKFLKKHNLEIQWTP